MILVLLLVAIDLHTFFMFVLENHLSLHYAFSGGSLAILKGLIFFLPSRDIFSLLDIITGLLVILNVFFGLPLFFKIIVYAYLLYKIVTSLAAFG